MEIDRDLPLTAERGLAADEAYFARAVKHVLAAEGATAPLEVGVRIVGDAEIQALHRDFFGLDYPTDVIAFGQQEQNLAATATPFATTRTEPAGLRYWQHDEVQPPTTQTSNLKPQTFIIPPLDVPYLGDIVASCDTAAAQAADYHHSTLEELTELVMHGTLHLLGYDDHDEDSYELMHSHEDTHLAAFLAAERGGAGDA